MGRGLARASAAASSPGARGGGPETGRVPSGGVKPSICPRYPTSSKACTAFWRFIWGHQVSDHCSQQPSVPDARSTPTATSGRRTGLRLDKAHLRGVVFAHEGIDLRDVALEAAHHHAEVLGGEARAVGRIELDASVFDAVVGEGFFYPFEFCSINTTQGDVIQTDAEWIKLIIGRYTGYRLLELGRFASFGER